MISPTTPQEDVVSIQVDTSGGRIRVWIRVSVPDRHRARRQTRFYSDADALRWLESWAKKGLDRVYDNRDPLTGISHCL